MNCLNSTEIQEYIDKEVDAEIYTAISRHLDSCDKCTRSYVELLSDIRMISESLDTLSLKPVNIPPIDQFIEKNSHKYRGLSILLKVAAVTLILIASYILIHNYSKQTDQVAPDEWMAYEYELMRDYDPNVQWHNNQMFVTIRNTANEIEILLIIDNKE